MDRKARRKRIAETSVTRSKRPAGKGRDAAEVRESEGGTKKASLFMNGRSQAVRLPKEFRFEGTHVYARKEGNRVILMPVDDRIERLIALMGSSPNFPDRAPDILEPMRPEIKVLFMSGYTDDAILQHGILDSGVAYLQKPLTPALLMRKVREVLERRNGNGK